MKPVTAVDIWPAAPSTAPIGYNDQGQPIEEVVTTATRLIPWDALLVGAGVGFLAYQLFSRPRAKRRTRSRTRR